MAEWKDMHSSSLATDEGSPAALPFKAHIMWCKVSFDLSVPITVRSPAFLLPMFLPPARPGQFYVRL